MLAKESGHKVDSLQKEVSLEGVTGHMDCKIDDEVVDINGVKVVGISYLASKVSSHASFALSNNIINWITDFYDEESHILNFDFEDEVIQSSVLAYEGKIMNERFA